jgi:hypothetical protein
LKGVILVHDWLPLGSVVMLSGGRKPAMIIGRNSIEVEGKTYHYMGCPYPEGFISVDYTFLFGKDDIQEMLHQGYKSNDDVEYLADFVSIAQTL